MKTTNARIYGSVIRVKHGEQIVDCNQAAILITGITEDAKRVLPETGLLVDFFPFQIGRFTRDTQVRNQYSIKDKRPYQISRTHILFYIDDEHIAVQDQNSYYGFELNGVSICSAEDFPSTGYLREDRNELCLGSEESSFRFSLQIIRKNSAKTPSTQSNPVS